MVFVISMNGGVEQQIPEGFVHAQDRPGLGYEIEWALVERETAQVRKKGKIV